MRRFVLALCAGFLLPGSALALDIEIHAGDDQVADPGFSVPIDPAVRVTDSFGLPVSGESVTFSIESGGGLVSGGVATTDSQGLAAVGSWALGTQPGEKELRATLDSEGDSVIFTAIAEGETDLQVDLAVEAPIIAGEPFLYELTISNDGPYTANGVQVSTDHDPLIDGSSIAWLCEPGGGSADCGADGVGPVFDHADIPPLGEVVYTIASSVPGNLTSGQVTTSAEIQPPVGILLSNPAAGTDSATGEINPNPEPIFSDRFEGDGGSDD